MRLAITGAAGMIGSGVANRLAREGHELILLDRRQSERPLPAATFVDTDLRDADRVRAAITGAEVVLHIGEIPTVHDAPDPQAVFESNTQACKSMLDASVAVGARRFIYTSSCQYYGYWGTDRFDRTRTPERWPIDELQPPCPANLYAYSKVINEMACRETSFRTGLEVFMFRFPWVVPVGGPRSKPGSDFLTWWEAAEAQVMDGFWTYVAAEDVAEAYALAVRPDRPLEPLPSRCEAFHFFADDIRGPRSIREKLDRHLPTWSPLPKDWPERVPPATCAKATRYLGWSPTRRLADLAEDARTR